MTLETELLEYSYITFITGTQYEISLSKFPLTRNGIYWKNCIIVPCKRGIFTIWYKIPLNDSSITDISNLIHSIESLPDVYKRNAHCRISTAELILIRDAVIKEIECNKRFTKQVIKLQSLFQ